jgi:hypothetical protein
MALVECELGNPYSRQVDLERERRTIGGDNGRGKHK